MANSFQQRQYEFAAYIRDPQSKPMPADIEPRRMAIYRDLFFNNINGTLANVFPVILSLYSQDDWDQMVRDFMIKHHCQTPVFVEIAREFIDYLQTERQAVNDPPFLTELAHYEWVELALSVSEAEFEISHLQAEDDCLDFNYRQSALAWLLIYQFPVHQIDKNHQPKKAGEQPSCLVVYRTVEDKVKFIELNPISARLLELLREGVPARKAIDEIAEAIQHPEPAQLAGHAQSLIQDWVDRGILLIQQS